MWGGLEISLSNRCRFVVCDLLLSVLFKKFMSGGASENSLQSRARRGSFELEVFDETYSENSMVFQGAFFSR